MHLSTPLIIPALLAAVQASTLPANLYHISAQTFAHQSDHLPHFEPQVARLVLASHLGVEKFHDLHGLQDDDLASIAQYGASQSSIFQSADDADDHRKLIVMAYGWDDSLESTSYNAARQFSFDAASKQHNDQLFQDLALQYSTKPDSCHAEKLEIQVSDSTCWIGNKKIVHVPVDYSSEQLSKILEKFTKNQHNEVLLVNMPNASRDLQSKTYPYGAYELPSTTNRRSIEDPLVEFTDPKASLNKPHSSQYSPYASNKTATLSKLPPVCYATNETCTTNTNTCSGHGSCFKKFSSGDSECFACRCEPVFHKDSNGRTRTTYYGGAACQKRDVSSQFWLIVSFTVVLVGLVSWAIGMLFSVGEEKLPGVIGAGVSGPKAGR